MPHIHTEPNQYDFTASAYIVRLDGSEPTIMLHRHRLLNKYLQFGGHVELHENLWSAVTHEVTEESGYAIGQLRLLQPPIQLVKISQGVLHPFPVATLSVRFGDNEHYHTDIAYAFVTNEPPQGVIAEGESTDAKLFTAAELAKLPTSEIPESVKEISLYILEDCLKNWDQIDSSTFDIANPED